MALDPKSGPAMQHCWSKTLASLAMVDRGAPVAVTCSSHPRTRRNSVISRVDRAFTNRGRSVYPDTVGGPRVGTIRHGGGGHAFQFPLEQFSIEHLRFRRIGAVQSDVKEGVCHSAGVNGRRAVRVHNRLQVLGGRGEMPITFRGSYGKTLTAAEIVLGEAVAHLNSCSSTVFVVGQLALKRRPPTQSMADGQSFDHFNGECQRLACNEVFRAHG